MPDSMDLQNLHDIIVPSPASWIPPAPGWYALGGTALLVLCCLAVAACQRWRRNAYRRQALVEIEGIERALAEGQTPRMVLPRVPELLKRTALAAYGRAEVASLSGGPWLDFLDMRLGRPLFSGENGTSLLVCAYGPATRLDSLSPELVDNLCQAARAWLAGHRTGEGHPSHGNGLPKAQGSP